MFEAEGNNLSVATLMETLQKNLSLEIRNAIPKVIDGSITPSQASAGKPAEFFDLLSQLGLPREPEKATETFKQQEDGRKSFYFDWDNVNSKLEQIPENLSTKHSAAGGLSLQGNQSNGFVDPAERASYAPLCKYLCDLGLDAVVVGDGEGLPGKLLYNVHAYSMRRNKKAPGQQVHYIKRIHGRTDLVVLDNRGKLGEVSRERVKFAIEVKPAKILKDQEDITKGPQISDDGVQRSVMTQLLGLNICNLYNSPPILLTNLVRTHIVYHITEHDELPWFRIACQKCSSFLAAIQFIESLLEKERCTAEFGRPCSPDLEE